MIGGVVFLAGVLRGDELFWCFVVGVIVVVAKYPLPASRNEQITAVVPISTDDANEIPLSHRSGSIPFTSSLNPLVFSYLNLPKNTGGISPAAPYMLP